MKSTSKKPAFRRAVAPPEFEEGELEWIEHSGIEKLKSPIATADTLAKEAATTLTVLLVGTGGAGAYAIKLFENEQNAAAVAAAAASAWLAVLSCALGLGCMMLQGISPAYNQPGQLLGRKNHTYAQAAR